MIIQTIKNIILLGLIGFIVLLLIDPVEGIRLLIKIVVDLLGVGYDAIVRSLL